MEDITEYFRENQKVFTIYVVEQRFAVGRGYEYFKSYKDKENYISTNRNIRKRILRITSWLQRHIPDISELLTGCFSLSSSGIVEVVTSLSKLFSVHEHQAVGPEVLDPIILQEGEILQKYVTQLITLHKSSILQPVIIILLKDNNFDRAKQLLCHCPHGILVKMIRNSGESESYKVINNGADDVESFLEAFSLQCFSTCSKTQKNILLNEEWSENSIVRQFSPSIFKIRTNLLFDEKDEVRDDINELISNFNNRQNISSGELILMQNFECMAKLFRVYCNDAGGSDLEDALRLATELDNEILLAHVYRYSHFLPHCTRKEKQDLLKTAENIFEKHNIEDHAIYCLNNSLIHQFSMDKINLRSFQLMQEKAIANVPGLVGMSYLYNNTGVAHLLTGNPVEAIEYFKKGLDYAHDRVVQKLGLISNSLIAKAYSYQTIDEDELRMTLRLIFDGMGKSTLPFITSQYVMNVISIALQKRMALANDLLHEFPIIALIQCGLDTNIMGSGSITEQMSVLSQKYSDFHLLDQLRLPLQRTPISGIRLEFIRRYGYNPFFFNAWL